MHMNTGHSKSSRQISGELSTTAEHTMLTEVSTTIWLSSLAKRFDQGVKYSIEASSSINTGVETTRSHLAD